MQTADRTTQNYSGVYTEGENQEKYYGQLEEIIELRYPYGYSTVLFWCKWFDTRRGVICENNLTSIDTQREWYKDDPLIFATQAKHVFYIREPSRGNQNNNHRWVVEHVNHRKIWDLPINDDRIDNSVENVDVIHSDSSSNSRFVIDFSQYFLQPSSHVSEESPEELEVEVPPRPATLDEESKGESDYDGDGSEYSDVSEADTEVSEEEID